MPGKRDFYEVLGVDKNADENQIKKLSGNSPKVSSDVNPDDKQAEEKFKEANEAYEVLSDPEKRRRYDQFGHAGVDGQGFGSAAGGFGGGFNIDLEDLFNSIFGGGFGFGYQTTRARTGPARGANLRYRMNLDFMEAAFGTTREINIKKEDICDTCKGKGSADGSDPETCSTCGGSGQVNIRQQTMFGQMMTTQTCSNCNGTGQYIRNRCSSCHGSGRQMKSKRLQVTVPAGINEGEMLTLRGEGEPGLRGGPFGDLYIEIHIRPHPVFVREGNQTYCEVPITFAQAALGETIEVPTIDGKESFKLKEGTQPGDVFTIRGKGIPYINRPNARGDHKFRVLIEVPRYLSDEQKDILRRFDDSCTEQHYQKRRGFFDKIKNIFTE